MTFHVFRKVCTTKMILRLQNMTARLCYRQLSSMRGSITEHSSSQSKSLTFGDSSSISSVVASVASVNPRLSALNLTAQYLSGGSLLHPATNDSPLKVHLPSASRPKVVSCPTLESLAIKKFIVEENLKRVEEPPAAKHQGLLVDFLSFPGMLTQVLCIKHFWYLFRLGSTWCFPPKTKRTLNVLFDSVGGEVRRRGKNCSAQVRLGSQLQWASGSFPFLCMSDFHM